MYITYMTNEVYEGIVARIGHSQPMCTKPKNVDIFVAARIMREIYLD